MSIVERITKDITTAMKEKAQARLDALRMVKSALKNKEIDQGRALEDTDVIKVLQTLIKQRREAAEQYVKGGRQELADKEMAEAAIIETYLPAPLSEAEIEQIVVETVAETGATSIKDMGSVMKVVMGKLVGQAVDGKVVSALVKKRLG